jgi:hypothetical protein
MRTLKVTIEYPDGKAREIVAPEVRIEVSDQGMLTVRAEPDQEHLSPTHVGLVSVVVSPGAWACVTTEVVEADEPAQPEPSA